ncbi:hypothetical protein QO207_10320 [Pseudomonas sp. CAN2814]|uniref:hypothetical protein n=1 Tax=Pseudomonas sp. CAN1 TaxID=3046726 RepID=UPI0026485636|nr:hypothetical protein [Pseudomonas sp. CAN1]MDN6856982.1 hypothetical protein [Pseudomonas sp. CAN1]
MAFYTGAANSFADLRTALFSACVAQGWTLTDDVLSKGAAFVKCSISSADTAAQGIGLILQGATGYASGALVSPAPVTPRLGAPSRDTTLASWPMEYSIHVFDSPAEVYLVARYNLDYYLWLAFGVSDVAGLGGSGLWTSAISRLKRGPQGGGLNISPITGGGQGSDHTNPGFGASSGALFWNTDGYIDAGSQQDAICSNLDGVLWPYRTLNNARSLNSFQAVEASYPLITRSPSAWNSEAILLPIQGYVFRASNKCSLVVDLRNARYVRVDNYEPGQIITLGSDRWRVYPFYRKNTAARNGGTGLDHSGTFGWAIRYDGP